MPPSASDFAIEYFKKLGVTAVELLPVHHFVNDDHLEKKGLSNYWGYNSIGYFAPHSTYCSSGILGQQVTEFKEMVKKLHAAGLKSFSMSFTTTLERAITWGRPFVSVVQTTPRITGWLPQIAATIWTTPVRKFLEHDASQGAAAYHGQPPLLDLGDACGWIPL